MDKAYILNAVPGPDDDLGEDLVTILPYFLSSPRVKLSDKYKVIIICTPPDVSNHLGIPGITLTAGGSVHRALCNSLAVEDSFKFYFYHNQRYLRRQCQVYFFLHKKPFYRKK